MRHLAAGDMEGVAVWKLILKAIEELLSEERPDDAEVHQTPQEARTGAFGPSRVLRTPNPITRILSHPGGVWLTYRSLPLSACFRTRRSQVLDVRFRG